MTMFCRKLNKKSTVGNLLYVNVILFSFTRSALGHSYRISYRIIIEGNSA